MACQPVPQAPLLQVGITAMHDHHTKDSHGTPAVQSGNIPLKAPFAFIPLDSRADFLCVPAISDRFDRRRSKSVLGRPARKSQLGHRKVPLQSASKHSSLLQTRESRIESNRSTDEKIVAPPKAACREAKSSSPPYPT